MKLSNLDTKQPLMSTLEERLQTLPLDSDDIEKNWASLRDVVYDTATEILGSPRRSHKDWFDENCDAITQLLDKKHKLHQQCLNDPTSTKKKCICYYMQHGSVQTAGNATCMAKQTS